MLRWLDVVLLLAALAGAILAWQSSRIHAELAAEYRRLAVRAGRMPIGDESKLHLTALETGARLHFAWQLYVPAGKHLEWRMHCDGTRGSSTFMLADSYRELVRLRFRKVDGAWQMWRLNRLGTAHSSGLGSRLERLLEHPERLQIEQWGTDGVVVLEDGQVHTLLRMTDSANEDGASGDAAQPPEVLLQVGTPEAWRKQEKTTRDD